MPIYLKQGEYKEACKDILQLLSPGLCEGCGCEGCKYEVEDALRTAKAVLGQSVPREKCLNCGALDQIWSKGPGHPDGETPMTCWACGMANPETKWVEEPADSDPSTDVTDEMVDAALEAFDPGHATNKRRQRMKTALEAVLSKT